MVLILNPSTRRLKQETQKSTWTHVLASSRPARSWGLHAFISGSAFLHSTKEEAFCVVGVGFRLQIPCADLAKRVHEHQQEIERDSVKGIGLFVAELR